MKCHGLRYSITRNLVTCDKNIYVLKKKECLCSAMGKTSCYKGHTMSSKPNEGKDFSKGGVALREKLK